MATDKQIHANRLNAQKSTGPKSPEGKKRVARNNMKHGLAGEHVVLSSEDQSAFDGLLAALFNEWNPQSETEAFLVESLAHNQWRLLRCMRMEKAACDRQLKARSGAPLDDVPMAAEDISRYETRSSRAYYRALDTLRKLKAERMAQGWEPESDHPAEPVAATPAPITDIAPPQPSQQPPQSDCRSNPITPPHPANPTPLPDAA